MSIMPGSKGKRLARFFAEALITGKDIGKLGPSDFVPPPSEHSPAVRTVFRNLGGLEVARPKFRVRREVRNASFCLRCAAQ